MDANFINPFIKSTVNVLTTMASIEPSVEAPVLKANGQTWGDVTGVIGMAGDGVAGNMLLSFDKASILTIVSKMLGETFAEVNKDVIDAVGELTNMISGGAKGELSSFGYRFNMATPLIVVGQHVELTQLTKAPTIQIPFSMPEGRFVCEANLGKRG